MVMVRGTTTIQEYTGGPKRVRGGLLKPKGTAGPAKASQEIAAVGALYDLGRQDGVIWGGVDFNGSTQSMARTSGAIPGVSGGAPQYPLTVVVWVKPDAVAASTIIWQWNDGSTNNRIMLYADTTTLRAEARASGTSSTAPTTGAFSVGRWTCCIGVWTSDSSRSSYADTNTTGGTETTTRAATGFTQVRCGNNFGSSNYWDGEIGPIWILSGDLSGAGNANLRGAELRGADPVRASRGVATLIAHYPMQAATGASQSGLYDLTPANSPTATSRLLVARDLSGNGRHVRATTAPPTYSASQGNGQGGGAFASALSQFLVYDGSVPTAAPLQVYAVGQAADVTAQHAVVFLGDKDTGINYWSLAFRGDTGGDPVTWGVLAGSGAQAQGATAYSAGADYVLWGREESSSSRSVQLNGGGQGTNSTNLSPTGVDRIGLGMYLDSSPSLPLNGQIHYVILLTTASTHAKSRIEKFLAGAFGITLS